MKETFIIPPSKPTREIVYEYLKRAILEKQIQPEERIIEMEYAQRFQISRTPVREALRMLEKDNLVEHIPRKGIVVRGMLSEIEILEIFEIRKALECLAARNAIVHATEKDVKKLKKNVEESKKAYNNNDSVRFYDLSGSFNALFLGLSKMPQLISMLDQLKSSLALVKKSNISRMQRQKEILQEHHDILEALECRDIARMEEVICTHLENSKKAYLIDNFSNRRRATP
jgi:DNA-binding GntR family transcriptional regulator